MALQINLDYKVLYETNHVAIDESFKAKFPQIESSIERSYNVPSAYVMVQSTESEKDKVTATVLTFFDAVKDLIITKKEYSFTPDLSEGSDNFHKQTYIHLKSLSEFAGAIDC